MKYGVINTRTKEEDYIMINVCYKYKSKRGGLYNDKYVCGMLQYQYGSKSNYNSSIEKYLYARSIVVLMEIMTSNTIHGPIISH